MQRIELIEKILLAVYGQQPNSDAAITNELVNVWINDAIAEVVKLNYKEAIQIDGVGYVNTGFYTTFKGLVPTQDEKFIWKIELPQIPVGLGTNEGVTGLRFKDGLNNVGINCTPMSANQTAYYRTMRPIPNTVLYYPEGIYLYVVSTLNLGNYTALITMISGGDSTTLTSTLNVPPDYIGFITTYATTKLKEMRGVPKDTANDGADIA